MITTDLCGSFLKTKAEVSGHVKNFITMIQTHFHTTAKFIRTDNGPEFMLSSFYASHGIIHQKSCVETPQQNGRVERKHQHILNVGRALLYQSKLPHSFGHMLFIMLSFLLIEFPHLYYKTNPFIFSSIINFLVFLFSKSLVVSVMLQLYILT